MWPVDEVDDGAEPPVPDSIATEARIGAHHYELLGVILSRGEGVWAWDAHWKRYLVCRTDKPRYSRALTTSTNAPAVSPASVLTRRHATFRTVRARQGAGGDHDIIWKQLASY
jgi:hypothetical protein